MFEQVIMDVNWIAVLVGAIVSFGLGALWYSPKMFGTKWMEGVGLTMENKGSMMPAMVAQAAATFLLAWVIGVTETTNSIGLAILIGIMVSAIVKSNGLWANKSKYAVIVESSYILVMIVIMILAHVIF